MQHYLLWEVAAPLLRLCTILCNVKREKCATYIQNLVQLPEFLWSHNYFMYTLRGMFG
jgi:hypothetical protein